MLRRQQIEAHYAALADQGLRGLLIASRAIPASAFDASGDLHGWVGELTFVGLVGLMDPPRPEAKLAIAQCKQAGISVKMITGDHPLTATAIANELGLKGRSLTGAELDRMDSDRLAAAIEDVTVFARVTPAHKVMIVRALQKKGHVVAMTGDGVNDAPALKSADIGVAMGTTGTAVAKEAATMVLTDDNFATLVSAVRQGRTLYDNILKFVRFQLSTTIGAILTVFFAPLAGLPEPFTAVQILWVAIIMDGPPAVSLALDAARPGIMSDPPRSPDRAGASARPPREDPRLRDYHDGGNAGGAPLRAACRHGPTGADPCVHDVRAFPVLQCVQRASRARHGIQQAFLRQRDAMGIARRRDHSAGGCRALAARAVDFWDRRP